MFGVILWSDPQSGEAVIWCEEHAGLAYCDDPAIRDAETSGRAGTSMRFDAGDLVEFDLADAHGRRLTATNLSAVEDTDHDMPLTEHAAPGTPADTEDPAPVIDLDQRRRSASGFFVLSRRG